MRLSILGLGLVLAIGNAAIAQENPYGPIDDVKLAKPEDGKDQPTTPPPAGAIVLFDGKNLDAWTKKDGKTPAAWKLVDGAVQVAGGGDIISKQKFAGSFKVHVEFRTPYQPKQGGQGRGNSGVYTQGRYEVQVLDSYGVAKLGEHDCGGIYGIAAPIKNMCKAPTVWQSYDIDFIAPVCEDGKKKEMGIITVRHNGELIHDKVKLKLDNTTSGAGGDVCTPGPILLQDHGNPVQFRNIWVLPVSAK